MHRKRKVKEAWPSWQPGGFLQNGLVQGYEDEDVEARGSPIPKPSENHLGVYGFHKRYFGKVDAKRQVPYKKDSDQSLC